ncbi:VOC family protein [Fulvivirgaceae bacterium BMA10]|uniref:VOC family protein n=1 Tax=Splendidivirga corallicola TaxID=3051826 RepID=A0ABT8KN59_9BACT|nr:VOC family protein [Fulvivirgaceae bacterium BMA10]
MKREIEHGFIGIEKINTTDEEADQLVGRFVGISLQVEDIYDVYQKLLSKGVTFVKPPEKQPWGGTLAHFFDYDKNVLDE